MSHHDQRILQERCSMLEERVHSYRTHCFALQKELNAAHEKIDQLIGIGIDRGMRGNEVIEWATKQGAVGVHREIKEPTFPENVNGI